MINLESYTTDVNVGYFSTSLVAENEELVWRSVFFRVVKDPFGNVIILRPDSVKSTSEILYL